MSGVTASLTGLLADPELAAFVRASREAAAPSGRQLGPTALRAEQRRRAEARPPGPTLTAVDDMAVPGGVAVRFYRPSPGIHPLVVFLHGGFWTIGDLESHDRACRRIAAGAGTAVLAVDFRRAPESPWPAAVEDVVRVLGWAASRPAELAGLDGRLVVAGDSSGGNLAALACLQLRDDGGAMPAAQVLAYPNTDLTMSQPSVAEKATGWGITADEIAWGAGLWVPDAALRADPRVSPLHATNLAGLPPAVIVTAEHDPLRDEGEAYAARLADTGAQVRLRREKRMIHGFLTLDTVSPAAARAGQRLIADIAATLTTHPASR
jgi:acetyl esterase/lipase